ncbi:hypothetical protein [Pseudomonas putida]|uniref:hypothetical protein n=1 Tax=Pseudomonas putida TaxID=303 RepID=UPI002DB74781|nr:hypothetical protein [Pseudomonas putida]WRW01704.1 hypothetical protein VPZ82_18400 [Pseudomonas putida]
MTDYNDINVSFTSLTPSADTEGCAIVQFDDNGKFAEAHAYGNFVEKIEGGMRLTRPDGSTITMQEGEITIENLLTKCVGIRDLSEIESLAVRTVDQLRIYRIDFFGGGHIEVVYTHDGQLLEYAGNNFGQRITNDNEVIVGARSSATL